MQTEIILLGILVVSVWVLMVYQYVQQHKRHNESAEIDVVLNDAIRVLTAEVNAIKRQVMELTQEVRIDLNDPAIHLDKNGFLDAQKYLDIIMEAMESPRKGEPLDTDEFAEGGK